MGVRLGHKIMTMARRAVAAGLMVGLMVGVLSGCTICKYASCYGSGKVQWERNFVDGKKEGKWFWYDEEGKIIDEDIYENGECVEMCEGDIFE